jgi:hypothetical protein
MPQIDLAIEAAKAKRIASRRRAIYAGVIVILGVLGLIWGSIWMLMWSVEKKTDELRKEVQGLQQQIAQRRGDERRVLGFQRRLEFLQALLPEHHSWFRVMESLERLSLPGIRFSEVKGNAEDGIVDIRGLVTEPKPLAELMVSLAHVDEVNETPFAKVELKSVRVDTQYSNAYRFHLKLTLRPDALKVLPEDIAVPAAEEASPPTPEAVTPEEEGTEEEIPAGEAEEITEEE